MSVGPAETLVWAIVVALAVGIALAAWWRVRRSGRRNRVPKALQPGQTLPVVELHDDQGNSVSTAPAGRTRVLIFLRGGWCPFCTSQVESLTANYKQIGELGADLVFVTPRPLDTTRRVAEIFGVDFTFWVDAGLAYARQLGIFDAAAVPQRFRDKYGPDAFRPTSLIVDSSGIIRFARVAPDVRTRPNPGTIVTALERLQ